MVIVPAQVGSAQSDADLRRENQRLRAELRDTQSELEAAHNRIRELEADVARLERALEARARPGDAPPPREEVTVDESDPSASPRALLNALVEDYRETLGDMEIGRPGDRAYNLYMRSLTRWQGAANRKYRSPIEWHVRVEDAVATRAGYELRLVAIDPKTEVHLGDPFYMNLPRGLARRYELLRDRGDARMLVLRGTMNPQIAINPDRRAAGAFDNPRLIGPFAEFGFTVEPRSLLAVGDEE